MKAILVLAVFSLLSCSSAQKSEDKSPPLISGQPSVHLEYDYNQLQLMDSEEVGHLIYERLKASQGDQNGDGENLVSSNEELVPGLLDCVRIILSRPDQDGTRNRMFGKLATQLRGLGKYQTVIRQLTAEALFGLDEAEIEPRKKVTYLVLLENLMSEMAPDLKADKFNRYIMLKIKEARVVVSDSVRNYYLVQSMKKAVSPSDTADLQLKKYKLNSRSLDFRGIP